MTLERHFLGWDAPVIRKVRDYLVPEHPGGPVDLRSILVLLPTQQAGRRLREALTLLCAEYGTYLLAPSLRTPSRLLQIDDAAVSIASPLDVAAVWATLLQRIDPSELPGLFPAATPEGDFRWALRIGAMLQSVRETLSEQGYSVRSVVDQFGDSLEEIARWTDIARMEEQVVSHLQQLGLADACSETLRRARQPELPETFNRIILACVPDPAPLSLHALEHLSEMIPVDVLIHAPETMADYFDLWGRPVAGMWTNETVELTDPHSTLKLASSPAGQTILALGILKQEEYGPGDTALGVPDSSVAPYLESALAEHGVRIFNPSGSPLSRHPLFRLLAAFHKLATEWSYVALSGFLRHPDAMNYLKDEHGIGVKTLLTELDTFQNTHLPETVHDIIERVSPHGADPPAWPALTKMIKVVLPLLERASQEAPESMLRSLLQTVYSTRMLLPEVDDDQEFRIVADVIDEALTLLSTGCVPLLPLTPHESTDVMLEHLAQGRYVPERPPGSIDLEGWLEIAWNDAPLLIVTGMNDGAVPQQLGDEAFMPESLRRTLGLRSESDRLARDIFLTRTLVESRRNSGRLYIITGKYGPAGEPLKPSRILLRCSNQDLPQRALRLFGDPDDTQPSVPSSVSFTLQPSKPLEQDVSIRPPDRLAVTSLRDYLACPFRFYLKHVLRMEPLTDTKREMDMRDFGTVVHEALASMAADVEMRCCDDVRALRGFLHRQVDRWTWQRFGQHPPLHLLLQLDVVRDRLEAAARVQADQVAQGWEIILYEEQAEIIIGAVHVRGRIDRVDRHRTSGVIRVLDYKTSDKPETPHEQHLSNETEDAPEYSRVQVDGKPRRWIDLQLPLYVMMLAQKLGNDAVITSGYFQLPRETSATAVDTWESLLEPLQRSARACADGLVADIQDRRFWPPSPRVRHEDFEILFPVDASRYVDGDSLTKFMETWQP